MSRVRFSPHQAAMLQKAISACQESFTVTVPVDVQQTNTKDVSSYVIVLYPNIFLVVLYLYSIVNVILLGSVYMKWMHFALGLSLPFLCLMFLFSTLLKPSISIFPLVGVNCVVCFILFVYHAFWWNIIHFVCIFLFLIFLVDKSFVVRIFALGLFLLWIMAFSFVIQYIITHIQFMIFSNIVVFFMTMLIQFNHLHQKIELKINYLDTPIFL
jgi:hypothetical protein